MNYIDCLIINYEFKSKLAIFLYNARFLSMSISFRSFASMFMRESPIFLYQTAISFFELRWCYPPRQSWEIVPLLFFRSWFKTGVMVNFMYQLD